MLGFAPIAKLPLAKSPGAATPSAPAYVYFVRHRHRMARERLWCWLAKLPRHRYTTPPKPSNLSWFQQNREVKRRGQRPRGRFFIRGRWSHFPRAYAPFPQFAPYEPEGVGRVKWRNAKPQLERDRTDDPELQK